MSNSTRDQFNNLLRSEGLNAGIIPVSNIPNEESRLNEVNRLGILNRDLDQEAQYNALTQLAAIITKSQIGLINILGSNIFNFTIVISAAGLISLAQEPLLMSDLIRDMIMILITLICFYIIIKNYNYMSTKFLCISLLVLFVIYQISLYEINI